MKRLRPAEVLRKANIKIGLPRLTRFEKARIVAARALQLSLGALPLIDIKELGTVDPIEIAMEELRRGVLPITLIREKPDGTIEKVSVQRLVEIERMLFGRVSV